MLARHLYTPFGSGIENKWFHYFPEIKSSEVKVGSGRTRNPDFWVADYGTV
jgi:hypothetical protein